MRVWTIQPIDVWHRLKTTEVLTVDPCLIDSHGVADNPIDPYKWMNAQMRKRLPACAHARYPWWGWTRWEGSTRPRPDLRCVAWWHPLGELSVRIELELPEEHVLLSDYDAWHAVLNGWFLSLSEQEDEAF